MYGQRPQLLRQLSGFFSVRAGVHAPQPTAGRKHTKRQHPSQQADKQIFPVFHLDRLLSRCIRPRRPEEWKDTDP